MKVLNFTVRAEEKEGGDPWDGMQAVVEMEGRELLRLPVSWVSLERHGEDELIDVVADWLRARFGGSA